MRKTLPAALLLASASLALSAQMPAQAQVYSGRVVAVDGDSLDMTGARIRLFGIDAVEKDQTCQRGGTSWSCGLDARQALSGLVAGREAVCTQQDTDDYGRVVAICRVGDIDLSDAVVRMGYAAALPHFTPAYVPAEADARARKAGIWAGTFEQPADYRKAHPRAPEGPRTEARPEPRTMSRPASRPAPQHAPARAASRSAAVFFRNCRDAWAAGLAPMRIGEPGYRPGLDGDSDGVACEPLPRR